jgi:GxxExxY protein
LTDVPPEIDALATIAVDCGFRLHMAFHSGDSALNSKSLGALAPWRESLRVERQKPIDIHYEGTVLREGFRIDLLVEDKLIIELKSTERTAPVHKKQLLTYLRLTDLPLGLLMNFGMETFKEGMSRVINRHMQKP